MKDETVAVTGGRGFLGRYVTAELERRGYASVIPLGSRDYDLTRPSRTAAMCAELAPAGIIHLAAAIGGIGAHQQSPARFSWANTVMGAHVFEAARLHGVRKVLVSGTICSYPADAPVPIREESLFAGFPAAETAPYGIAKRNLWMMGTAYRQQHGLAVAHVVLTNLYGPHDHFDESRSHVVAALVRRILEAREADSPEVVIWGDGSATREFLHAEDAARGIVDAFERYDSDEPINLGSGQEVTIRTLATTVRELAGYRGRLTWDPTRPTGAPRRALDSGKARRELGFEPSIDLEAGLAQTLEWYAAQGALVR